MQARAAYRFRVFDAVLPVKKLRKFLRSRLISEVTAIPASMGDDTEASSEVLSFFRDDNFPAISDCEIVFITFQGLHCHQKLFLCFINFFDVWPYKFRIL